MNLILWIVFKNHKCHKMWKPEPSPAITIQEGLFGAGRMAQLYIKQCEFCGHIYKYYA